MGIGPGHAVALIEEKEGIYEIMCDLNPQVFSTPKEIADDDLFIVYMIVYVRRKGKLQLPLSKMYGYFFLQLHLI